jgi:hypothetical protein
MTVLAAHVASASSAALRRGPAARPARILEFRVTERVVSDRLERLLGGEDLAFRIASSQEDYCGAFALVYQNYVRGGLARANPYRMRVTPYQLSPQGEVMVAVRGREVVATMTLVRDGKLGLPMEAVYADQLDWLRAQGLFLAEVSCLADRRDAQPQSPATAMRLMSLMAQCAQARGVNQLLIAVHPRHARFYQRFTAFRPIGGLRQYHAVCDRPAVALALDIDRAPFDHPHLYRRFFGLPFPKESLACRPMPEHLRKEFEPVVEASYDAHVYWESSMAG